ncbi:hypothetical protein [Streptomyces ardesiacus]|uniref:hypothetical protein n=1 Tax=Streptomyces ardesiacus TaxID=285564 RepID=UPI0038063E8E
MRIPFFTHWRLHRDLRDTSLTMLLHSNAQLHDDMADLKRQMRELARLNQRRELLVIAAQAMVDEFDSSLLAADLANNLSNAELEPLLDLFIAAGRPEAAEVWKNFHSDEDPDPFAKDENEDQDQPDDAQTTAA